MVNNYTIHWQLYDNEHEILGKKRELLPTIYKSPNTFSVAEAERKTQRANWFFINAHHFVRKVRRKEVHDERGNF